MTTDMMINNHLSTLLARVRFLSLIHPNIIFSLFIYILRMRDYYGILSVGVYACVHF